MLNGAYEAILEELGRALGIAGLRPDSRNTCLIKFKDGSQVYIEMDKDADYLMIGAELTTIAPGRYRESLFAAALKSNALPYPKIGTFAYSENMNCLVMFERLWVKDLNGSQVAERLTAFIEKIRIWKSAIADSEVPTIAQMTTSDRQAGIFGLRP